jgi:glutamate synthase (ferredoxin)
VLGQTGKNFAAGMSGGIAYVLDEDNTLYRRLNRGMVIMEPVAQKHDVAELRELVSRHVEATGSTLGARVLADFDAYLPKFKRIVPRDYQRMVQAIAQREERGMTHEQAEMDAFVALAAN